jgi:hypothetical protein
MSELCSESTFQSPVVLEKLIAVVVRKKKSCGNLSPFSYFVIILVLLNQSQNEENKVKIVTKRISLCSSFLSFSLEKEQLL